MNPNAPRYLVLGSFGAFTAFYSIFNFACLGLGVSRTAVATLSGVSLLALFGNLLIWRALQDFRVTVTDQEIILVGKGLFGRALNFSKSSIESVTTENKVIHQAEAKLVLIKLKSRSQPLRLLVKDPAGLFSALRGPSDFSVAG